MHSEGSNYRNAARGKAATSEVMCMNKLSFKYMCFHANMYEIHKPYRGRIWRSLRTTGVQNFLYLAPNSKFWPVLGPPFCVALF